MTTSYSRGVVFNQQRSSTPLDVNKEHSGYDDNKNDVEFTGLRGLNEGHYGFSGVDTSTTKYDLTVRPIFAGLSARSRQNAACALYSREESKGFRHLQHQTIGCQRQHEIESIERVKFALGSLRRGFAALASGNRTMDRVKEIAKYQADLLMAFSTANNKAMSNALLKASEKVTTMFTNLATSLHDVTTKLRRWPNLLTEIQCLGHSMESILTTGKWSNVFTLLQKQMRSSISSIVIAVDDVVASSIRLHVQQMAKQDFETVMSDTSTAMKGLEIGYSLFKANNELKEVFEKILVRSADNVTDLESRNVVTDLSVYRSVKHSSLMQLPQSLTTVGSYLSIANKEKARQLAQDAFGFVTDLFIDDGSRPSGSDDAELNASEQKKIRLKKFKRYLLLRWRQEKDLYDVLSTRLLHSNSTTGETALKSGRGAEKKLAGGNGMKANGVALAKGMPDITAALTGKQADAIKLLLKQKSVSPADIERQLRMLQADGGQHSRKDSTAKTKSIDNRPLVELLSDNLWRDGISIYCRSVDQLWCPAIATTNKRSWTPTHKANATIDDVLNFTKLVFRSLAVNFQKEDNDQGATRALLVNASIAQGNAVSSDWEAALYTFMVTSAKDKCRLTSTSSAMKDPMTQTMNKFLTCFGLLRKLPTSSGSTLSLSTSSDLSESVAFWRPALSSQLSVQCQVEAGISWMRCKLQQFLSSGAWDSYFTVCRHDGKIIQSLVDEFETLLSDCQDVDNNESAQCSYLLRNIATVKKQLDYLRDYSTWTHTALIRAIKSRTFNCLEENFPPSKQWRKKSKSTAPLTEANSYVVMAATQVLSPLAASLHALEEQDVGKTLSVAVEAFIETWMMFILKKEIMFSLSGAHQLRRDLTEFQRWLSDTISHVSSDAMSEVLNIPEFTQMHDAISLLGCQSQRRRGSYADSEYSGASSISTSSNFSQGSEMTSFEDFIREVEIPHKEKWLSLRLKGGSTKSKLLCLS